MDSSAPNPVAGSLDRCRPAPRQEIEEVTVVHEMVLVDEEENRALSLNTSARAVWELCDGSRTVREISEALADLIDEDVSALREDVHAAIHKLHEENMLVLNDPES